MLDQNKNTFFVLLDDKKRDLVPKIFSKCDKETFKAWNEKGWGVYFSVNKFSKARKIEFCTELSYVYADLDIAKAGDKMERIEKQNKKMNIWQELINKCEPTKIIETSNGIQPLWKITNSEPTPENIKLYTRVIKGIVAWSGQYGCKMDNVYDVSRILRMPNFNHQKEEPFMCGVIHESDKTYSLEELIKIFPYEEEKKYVPKPTQQLGVVAQAIENLDIQEIVIKAFGSIGRQASFDKQGRLILDGRLTGTFQGKKNGRGFIASSSHEPFQGNRITVVADILDITNKEAYQWIVKEFNLKHSELEKKEEIKKKLEKFDEPAKAKKDKKYSWGTENLDNNFAIIKSDNFIVVGAKRDSGKTTFTFNMAVQNARMGNRALYISLEMESEDILENIGRKYSGISIPEEFKSMIPEYKIKAKQRKEQEIKSIPNLFIKGMRKGNTEADWKTIKEVILSYKDIDIVFIDNLDMIAGEENENDWNRQKRISKEIMSFCPEYQIPIVLLHHYRKSSVGKDHGMDELSGSGKLADNADRIIKIVRNTDVEAVYPEKYKSTVILQKARGYQNCIVDVYFIKGEFVDNPPMIEDYVEPNKIVFNKPEMDINNLPI